MKERFYALADRLAATLRAGEVLLANFAGERSDFVRFNRARVRQAGSVEQRSLSLRLIRAQRQATAILDLGGGETDFDVARTVLARLRESLDGLPEDPWLLINEQPQSTDDERTGALAPAEEVVAQALRAAAGRDLVGLYAGGTIYRGFANSLGQKNWHAVDSFNFDFSLYAGSDRAVKSGYAGFAWDVRTLAAKLETAASELALLEQPRRELAPGEYRAYLAPRALEEIAGMLCWGGFSARERATKQSPLLRMEQGESLDSRVSLIENTAEGVAPGFQSDGFVKPPRVVLIDAGHLAEPLVSPRSAREYDLATNAASVAEAPESLELAGGELAQADALAALDRGLAISNLWYLNYSDRPAARITGMTRFATFWVENGRLAAPVAPLRFDDSIYRLLGANLDALTRERELLLDSSTYEARSAGGMRLPGALVRAMRFTL